MALTFVDTTRDEITRISADMGVFSVLGPFFGPPFRIFDDAAKMCLVNSPKPYSRAHCSSEAVQYSIIHCVR